ncbi:MAG: hypothetical protein ACD_2C00122G0003 [uncultured bacterium (gcode 4)]|uniref:Uncharacterized protein n=1 Tax=uncultured bacterium (gcode 4) TaxID=1234023 RepID=K2FER2_9BACT|nr:MAG: hypothetical protein ACD_2C00122G0003 [uncultured bacterium (gcode 4)]
MKTSSKIVALLTLTLSVYFLMIFVTIPELMSYSKWLEILDMKPLWYDYDYVKKLFDALGENWRDTYLRRQLVLDSIYPLLFMITYSYIIKMVYENMLSNKKITLALSLTAILWWFFDYFENFGIMKMIIDYPDNLENLAKITNIFSVLKSSFSTITFLTIIVWIMILLIRKIIK